MATTLSDIELTRIQQIVDTDPQIQAILRRARLDPRAKYGKAGPAWQQQASDQIKTRLEALGVTVPHDYGVSVGDGKFDRAPWLSRNQDWLAAATFAALGGAPFLMGGGVAGGTLPATTTIPTAGTLPTGGTGLAGVGGGAAGGGATAAGSAAAGSSVLPSTTIGSGYTPAIQGGTGIASGAASGGGMGVFKDLFSKDVLPYVIGGAAQVGGAAIAAHGNTEAAKIQAAAYEKALAQEKEIYEQQRKDLEPYRGLGSGAVGNLAYLGGINLPPTEAQTPPATATPPVMQAPKPETSALPGRGNITVGRLAPWANSPKFQGAAMNQPLVGGAGMVRMQNPQTGLVHLIPADQVSAAEAAGGMRI